MIVAVGSTRGPKVEAVRRVLALLAERKPRLFGTTPTVLARAVPSGTASTPRSTAETMAGARQRAEGLYPLLVEEGRPPALSVGLEGGVVVEPVAGGAARAFLECWAYATNGERGAFGSGGCLELPSGLAAAVLGGDELGPAADAFYARRDVAGREGTFGLLTDRLVGRDDAFVRALLHCLAPFYNAPAYARADRKPP